MNSFVAFFAVLAVANAGVLVAPSAKIIQGPSTRTTVVGPDGSAISSVAPGGQIVQEESVGVVAQTAPVVAAPALAYSAPFAYHAAPAVAYSAYGAPAAVAYSAYHAPAAVAYHAPAVAAYSVPAVSENTVVAGPSGTISTSKGYAAPAVVAAF